MPEAESTLLERARAGDREALSQLLRQYDPALRVAIERRIPRRWRSLLAAEDVLQHAYADAFLRIAQFQPQGDGAFSAWLTRLATNDLSDAIRALEADKRGGGRVRIEPADDDAASRLWNGLAPATTRTTPSSAAIRNEVQTALRAALRRLPADYRRVIELYDLDGKPISEAASVMDRSVGAAHLLRLRAHRRLRELLHGKTTDFVDRS